MTDMKLIASLELLPTPEQANVLKRTLETANAAWNAISRMAWVQQVFRKHDLQQRVSQRIKDDDRLSAQTVIRCLANVGDSSTHVGSHDLTPLLAAQQYRL